jgi:hypothetical protein
MSRRITQQVDNLDRNMFQTSAPDKIHIPTTLLPIQEPEISFGHESASAPKPV